MNLKDLRKWLVRDAKDIIPLTLIYCSGAIIKHDLSQDNNKGLQIANTPNGDYHFCVQKKTDTTRLNKISGLWEQKKLAK